MNVGKTIQICANSKILHILINLVTSHNSILVKSAMIIHLKPSYVDSNRIKNQRIITNDAIVKETAHPIIKKYI